MDESQNAMQLSCTESLLTASQYAKVIFHDVPGKYNSEKDLHCQYTILATNFQTRFGDRIALFKLGWHAVTDYQLFEWAPEVQPYTRCSVVFQACNLPQDPREFFQFCYINAENAMCGASVPFQFSPAENRTDLDRSTIACHACAALTKQNQFLEKTISHVNSNLSKYDGQVSDLRKDVDTLTHLLDTTRSDISQFKTRLEMAGDEFKKLYLEKKRIERKYDKLVKKCLESKKTLSSEVEELPGELAPLPAFPLPLCHT